MSKRPPEWFEQYQRVSDKQRVYLNKVRELRRSIQNKDTQSLLANIVQERKIKGRRWTPKYPSMRKMEKKVILFGPEPFPHRPENNLNKANTHKFHFTPTILPRNLPPLIKHKSSSDADLNRNDTDLRNIITVADNNKRSAHCRSRMTNMTPVSKAGDKKILSISRVSVKEMMSTVTPMEYITNVSSKKIITSGRQ